MIVLGSLTSRAVRVLAWLTAVAVLALAFVVGPSAERSDATTASVATETQFRIALTELSNDASGNHTINISADFAISDISADPVYFGTRNLTINGGGHTISGAGRTISGDTRIVEFLWFHSAAVLTVNDLTVADFTAELFGGAISTEDGDIAINDSVFSGNAAQGYPDTAGGAIYSDTGDVTIARSTFTGNSTQSSTAILTSDPASSSGGAIYAGSGIVTVVDSVFTGNCAMGVTEASGGAIFVAGGGALAVATSTFAGNCAHASDGGGYASGGAISSSAYLTFVEGSTLDSNTAIAVGDAGTADGGAIGAHGDFSATNTTLVGNWSIGLGGARGGAVSAWRVFGAAHLTASGNKATDGATVWLKEPWHTSVSASVIVNPIDAPNCSFDSDARAIFSTSFLSDSSCSGPSYSNIVGGDPELGALADNGGPTLTMAPASTSSPLVDAIPTVWYAAITVDQRGVSRDQGSGRDIGAVEMLQNDSGVIRLAGGNRNTTATAVSARQHTWGATGAFVATGLNFPDALAGAAAAGGLDAPLLLAGISLPLETSDELHRLHPDNIYILGGTSAVPTSVETALGAYGTTHRIASTDRYATAVAISQHSYPASAPVVVIATGTGFADALAGGPAAAKLGGPVLLTGPDTLPQVVADEITRLNPSTIIVLGGTSAIGDTVFSQLSALAPATTRVYGASRYETAVAISQYAFPTASDVDSVYVAVGTNFPDALAGAAAAAANGAPILLTPTHSLPSSVADEIDRLGVGTIYILGGTSVISTNVETQLGTHVVSVP